MSKKKKILWIALFLVVALTVLSPSALAKGKEGLAHIVQEHAERIEQLENMVNSSEPSTVPPALSPEVKKALLKEARATTDMMYELNVYDGRGVTVEDIQLEEVTEEVVLKIYTDGTYDWTNSTDGIGRSFSSGMVANFDHIAKMYGVNLKYEFYENGDRITLFTEVD